MAPRNAESDHQRAVWQKLMEAQKGRGHPTQSGHDWLFFCPCHEDGKKSGKRSLSVQFQPDGSTQAHCFACGGGKVLYDGLSEALNLPRTIFDGEDSTYSGKTKKSRVEGSYIYTDSLGQPVYKVERRVNLDDRGQPTGGKFFFQFAYVGGKWEYFGGEKKPRPAEAKAPSLYNLPSVLAAAQAGSRVYVVEGEKCADLLNRGGLTATTSGSAKSWKPEFGQLLQGAEVVILPDNDPPGLAYASQVAQSIPGARILPLPDLQEKEDVFDWVVKHGHRLEELSSLLAETPPEGRQEASPPEKKRRFQVLRDHEFENRPPKPWLLDQFLGIGDFVMVAGQPGAGKTFVVLDMALALALGLPFAGTFEAERGPVRVLYLSSEGHQGFPARYRAAKAKYGLRAGDPVPNFSLVEDVPNFYASSGEDAVSQFIEDILASGIDPDLIVVDTFHDSITGANENDSGDAGVVLKNIQRVRQALNCTVLVVHHTGKSGESERGSSAYRGKADLVVTIETTGSSGEMVCKKIKDGSYFDPIPFSLAKDDPTNRKEVPRVSWQGERGFQPVLTQKQEEVLKVLRDSGEPLTSSEVAEVLGQTAASQKNNITTTLSALHRRGLASRRPRGPGPVNARNPYVFQAFEPFAVALHIGGVPQGVFSNHAHQQEEAFSIGGEP